MDLDEVGNGACVQVEVDPELVDLVPDYLIEVHAGIDTIIESMAQGNLANVIRISHNLAGTGGSFGFNEITLICRKLESAGERHHHADMDKCIVQLSAYMKQLKVLYPTNI